MCEEKKKREDEREKKREDEKENERENEEREMKRGEFFQKKKSFRTLKPARGISPKCFEKKSPSDELFLHLSFESAESGRFSIIYMIRIRFFGPREIKSEGFFGRTVREQCAGSPWKQGLTQREWCPLGSGISASHWTVQAGVDSREKQPGKGPQDP